MLPKLLRISLKEKRKQKFFGDFNDLLAEMKVICEQECVTEICFIIGASALNPKEVWQFSFPKNLCRQISGCHKSAKVRNYIYSIRAYQIQKAP